MERRNGENGEEEEVSVCPILFKEGYFVQIAQAST